jgi:hypothetical protein
MPLAYREAGFEESGVCRQRHRSAGNELAPRLTPYAIVVAHTASLVTRWWVPTRSFARRRCALPREVGFGRVQTCGGDLNRQTTGGRERNLPETESRRARSKSARAALGSRPLKSARRAASAFNAARYARRTSLNVDGRRTPLRARRRRGSMRRHRRSAQRRIASRGRERRSRL